jgi:hypothetical protein
MEETINAYRISKGPLKTNKQSAEQDSGGSWKELRSR